MENILYIIRGLPGSGKSTEARRIQSELSNKCDWFEADMFFVNPHSEQYEFNRELLGKAHAWCREKTEISLSKGNSVIVSNTFSTLQELKPYQYLANKLGIKIDIRQMNNSFGSIHNVPEDTIFNMKKRWQVYPDCIQIPAV
jgi:predicted kinase